MIDNEVVSDADENFTDADDCFSADEEDDFFSTANENFPETHNVKQFNGEHGCNWCYQKGEVVEKGNGFTKGLSFAVSGARAEDTCKTH
ncbi:hypothetical protein QQF64_020120 [Cirrhinus molitorella]|uniref:Uncharacterized protein n=1 Tax=Cirrhinus molitorella TaxID=172907 RepID=A0ABR3LKR7_9TELE